MKNYPKLSIVGPFPPPVHGAAEVTEHIACALENLVRLERVAISPADGLRGFRYHGSRLARVLRAAAVLASGRGPVYLSAAGGFGLGYNVLLTILVRAIGRPLFIHHHSFAYLDRNDPLAGFLIRAAGPSALHICLCQRMADLLIECYGPMRTIIVSNAVHCPPTDRVRATPAALPLRLGHLSNLSLEKGLDFVVDLAVAIKKQGIPVQLVLAGPAVDARVAAVLEAARSSLGVDLTELGPLYGPQKNQFFDSVDVFVFPSRYVNEAEPLVIFEALARGLPVVAIGRGCISELIGDAGLAVVPNGDFISLASAAIAVWSDDRNSLAGVSAVALTRAHEWHDLAQHQFSDLLMRLREAVAWSN